MVANDADARRCNLLTHQTKRMCSPALVVTNHDATMMPLLRASPKVGSKPCQSLDPASLQQIQDPNVGNSLLQMFV